MKDIGEGCLVASHADRGHDDAMRETIVPFLFQQDEKDPVHKLFGRYVSVVNHGDAFPAVDVQFNLEPEMTEENTGRTIITSSRRDCF